MKRTQAIIHDSNQSILMRELGDIKANLAVNSNETANIKQRVTELQVDVKELKTDVAGRVAALEIEKVNKEDFKIFTDDQQITNGNLGGRIRILEDWKIWVIAYATGISATVYFVLNYIFKGKI